MPSPERIIQSISGITDFQKQLLKDRYVSILNEFGRRCLFYAIAFHTFRFVVTVGSLLVPALLSVDFTGSNIDKSFKDSVYWSTWALSVAVTTSNGIMTLFKVDKKYYFLHTTYEQLRSEGWQYFELTGRYSGQLTKYLNEPPSYANQFIHFCANIEKIKMKQVEEEYYKLTDHATNAPAKPASSSDNPARGTGVQQNDTVPSIVDSLYPPTPDHYGLTIKNMPKETMNTMQAILAAMQPSHQSQQQQQQQEKKPILTGTRRNSIPSISPMLQPPYNQIPPIITQFGQTNQQSTANTSPTNRNIITEQLSSISENNSVTGISLN
jgi:hypothetical protein